MATKRIGFQRIPASADAATTEYLRSVENIVRDIDRRALSEEDLPFSKYLSGLITEEEAPVVDTVPPDDPTGVTAAKFTNRNVISWINPSNTDLKAIYIWRDNVAGGTNKERIAAVTAPVATYSDYGADPLQDWYYWIQAVDDAGNWSSLVPISSVNNFVLATDMPAPANLRLSNGAAAWSQFDLNVEWDAVTAPGIAGYSVATYNGGNLRRTETVTGNSYTYGFSKNTEDGGLSPDLIIRVRSIDSDGTLSVGEAELSVTHALPAAITNFKVQVARTQDIGFILTWDKPTDPIVSGCDVALADDVLESSYGGNQYLHKSLLSHGTYSFKTRTVNAFGQVSAWNEQIVVVNKPGLPRDLTIKVLDNTALLDWEPPLVSLGQLPTEEYEIYKQDIEQQMVISIGTKKGSFTTDVELIPGTYQYSIQAIDIAGNRGELTSVTAVMESPNFHLLTDVIEDMSSATRTNFYVTPEGLGIAPVNVTETFAEHFTNNGFTTIQDFIDAGYFDVLAPHPVSADYELEFDYGAVVNQATNVTVLSDVDNKGATIQQFVASSETTTFTNEIEAATLASGAFRYVRDRLEITGGGGNDYAYFNSKRLTLSSKLREENHPFIITVAGDGATITFNKPFVSIESISITLKFGSEAISTVYDDGTGTPIPTMIVYGLKAENVFATGSGTVNIKGY